jgi:hypothetical protein
MRITRSARLGGILAGVVAMSAAVVPPASAHSEATIDFQGRATLTAGLGTPGTNGTPTVTANPGAGKKTAPFVVGGGNTRTGTFASASGTGGCVGTGTNAPDKQKPTTQGPNCSIQATFTVRGFCGLSSGSGTGTVVLGGQTRWYNFTWTDPGGNMVVLGNWWKTGPTKPPPGQVEGDIVAFVKATPDPTPGTGSCTNKTAANFIVVGTATLIHPKCSPPGTLPGCALP